MFAQLKKDYLKGWATAAQQMSQAKDYSHTIFGPKFHQELRQGHSGKVYGKPGKDKSRQYTSIPQRDPIKIEENPVQFAGAMGARFLTDIGTDSTRRFYWHYNHPLPIADKVAEQIIGADAAAQLRPAGLGGTGRFSNKPVQAAAIRLAGIGIPVTSSIGHLDLTNPEEQFRPKGYKQKYTPVGSQDKRKSSQVGPELFDRVVLSRRGRPLKYETAKQEIPDLTPERYGNFLRHTYQDKGLLGLGIVKATGSNLEGVPEASIIGFPVGLQAIGATVGGGLGTKAGLLARDKANLPKGMYRPIKTRGVVGRAAGGAVAGMLAGKLMNNMIAAGNRPSYPTTLEY